MDLSEREVEMVRNKIKSGEADDNDIQVFIRYIIELEDLLEYDDENGLLDIYGCLGYAEELERLLDEEDKDNIICGVKGWRFQIGWEK